MAQFPLGIALITCPQWGARKPKGRPLTAHAAERTIFHHTAGHHRQLDGTPKETREECIQYARDIQDFHMNGNGWNDSGHNFLVCRNGLILQGRWLTVSTIQAGQMVVSAHCPGQNTQVGIEHEHFGNEEMPDAQKEASAMLMAWIGWQYGRKEVLPLMPHSKYFATACPANLVEDIGPIVKRAQTLLNQAYAA